METLKEFQTQGNRPIILSTLDLKPIKPYVSLIPLKIFNREHHKVMRPGMHGGDGSKSVMTTKAADNN